MKKGWLDIYKFATTMDGRCVVMCYEREPEKNTIDSLVKSIRPGMYELKTDDCKEVKIFDNRSLANEYVRTKILQVNGFFD